VKGINGDLIEARGGWRGTLARRRYEVLLGCVVLLSLVMRVYASLRCSFWLDEVWTLQDSGQPWPLVLRGPSREHPPLMYWLVRLSMNAFGTSETAVRLTSLAFGCVLLVATYYLCLELEFDPPAALIVVVSVALAPFFLNHAIEARQYAMMPAFTTLATVFTLRLLRRPTDTGSLVGLAVSGAGAVLTHYFALAYVLALLGALAVGTVRTWAPRLWSRRVGWKSVLVLAALALVIGCVAFGALRLVTFYRSHRIGGRGGSLIDLLRLEFAFVWDAPRVVLVEPFVSAAGLVYVGLRVRGIARVIPFGLAFPPCALASLISTGHFVASRYLAPSFVFYQLGATSALLALWALVRGGEGIRPPWSWLRRALAAPLLIVPLFVRAAQYPAAFGTGRAYYEGLARYFTPARSRTTALVVFPRFPGRFIVEYGYPVKAPVIDLESFAPVPGVRDYLVADFGRANRRRELEQLVGRHFHVSPRRWEALPRVELDHTEFQGAVNARLLHWPR